MVPSRPHRQYEATFPILSREKRQNELTLYAALFGDLSAPSPKARRNVVDDGHGAVHISRPRKKNRLRK